MKPKVVLLSAFLTPLRSGAESCVEEIALRLKDAYDITIVTARLTRRLPEEDLFQRMKIPVVRVGLGSRFDKWLFPLLAPFIVRRLKPQIVHAVLESFAGLAMVFSRFLCPSVKTVLTCQSTNTSFLVSLMHRRADRVTVISRALMARALTLKRADALLIPNGVDVRAIEHACAEYQRVPGHILFVGRLEPMKGVDTLIRAFARLREAMQKTTTLDLRLRIVGRGSENRALQRLAGDLGLSDCVTFAGFVPMPQVYREFAEAQVFCGLSRSEALGNVFLEAQAAGCAVVSTRVGGIPEIVDDGRTGLLVPPDDAEAAAQALRTVLTDQRKWAELAEKGMASARTCDWSGIVQRYAEVYRGLLS